MTNIILVSQVRLITNISSLICKAFQGKHLFSITIHFYSRRVTDSAITNKLNRQWFRNTKSHSSHSADCLKREQSYFFSQSHARRAKKKSYANFKWQKKEERLWRREEKGRLRRSFCFKFPFQ